MDYSLREELAIVLISTLLLIPRNRAERRLEIFEVQNT
jgi:hypothetical protein